MFQNCRTEAGVYEKNWVNTTPTDVLAPYITTRAL